MKVSAKTQYACIAMIELAGAYAAGAPLQIRRIADVHDVPSRFLVQILLQLKGAGLVISTRGAAGGYRLAKDPAEITLGDVVAVIEGPTATEPETAASPDSPAVQVLNDIWQQADRLQQQLLADVTLAELASQMPAPAEHMYYI